MFSEIDSQRQAVQAYYGQALASARDLKTNACRCSEALPLPHRAILANIAPEILERFYGCGSPIPPLLDGCRVLDLGCGAGRDSYLLSALVGPRGQVVGVDMTAGQLEVARRYRRVQAQRFGFDRPNVDFLLGHIEDLAALGIESDSFDVVVSNCVINLSPEKERVFAEIHRVLKPGGELLFSDVFAGHRLPTTLRDDPLLQGECLAGAMYVEDFRRLLTRCGWPDYRVLARHAIDIGNAEVEAHIGASDFSSMTVRTFKLAGLEDACEDYGQIAVYLGGISGHAQQFALDAQHVFMPGKPMLVCGNTAAMLGETRYAAHFRVLGDRSCHFGRFDCAGAAVPMPCC